MVASNQDAADPVRGPVTVSIGIASAVPTTQATVGQLIESADKQLYAAKGGGRNQVRGLSP